MPMIPIQEMYYQFTVHERAALPGRPTPTHGNLIPPPGHQGSYSVSRVGEESVRRHPEVGRQCFIAGGGNEGWGRMGDSSPEGGLECQNRSPLHPVPCPGPADIIRCYSIGIRPCDKIVKTISIFGQLTRHTMLPNFHGTLVKSTPVCYGLLFENYCLKFWTVFCRIGTALSLVGKCNVYGWCYI